MVTWVFSWPFHEVTKKAKILNGNARNPPFPKRTSLCFYRKLKFTLRFDKIKFISGQTSSATQIQDDKLNRQNKRVIELNSEKTQRE